MGLLQASLICLAVIIHLIPHSQSKLQITLNTTDNSITLFTVSANATFLIDINTPQHKLSQQYQASLFYLDKKRKHQLTLQGAIPWSQANSNPKYAGIIALGHGSLLWNDIRKAINAHQVKFDVKSRHKKIVVSKGICPSIVELPTQMTLALNAKRYGLFVNEMSFDIAITPQIMKDLSLNKNPEGFSDQQLKKEYQISFGKQSAKIEARVLLNPCEKYANSEYYECSPKQRTEGLFGGLLLHFDSCISQDGFGVLQPHSPVIYEVELFGHLFMLIGQLLIATSLYYNRSIMRFMQKID